MRESYVTTLLFTMLNTTVYLDNCVFFLRPTGTACNRRRFVFVDEWHATAGKVLRALCKYLDNFPRLRPVHR